MTGARILAVALACTVLATACSNAPPLETLGQAPAPVVVDAGTAPTGIGTPSDIDPALAGPPPADPFVAGGAPTGSSAPPAAPAAPDGPSAVVTDTSPAAAPGAPAPRPAPGGPAPPPAAVADGSQDPTGAVPGGIGGPGDRTGVSDTEVRIGVTGYFPGNEVIAGDLKKAFDAYAALVNDQGGVHGRRVVFDIVDTGDTSTAGGVDAAKQVEGRVLINCECQGTDNAVGAGAYLDSRGVPHFLVTATDAVAQGLQHGYTLAPTTETFVRRTLEYMAGPLGLRGETVGMIRSNSGVWGPADDLFPTYARELGMVPGPTRITEPTQVSFIAELQAMQTAGVTAVFCFCSLEIVGLVRDGRSIGYEPTYAGPTFSFDTISLLAGGSLDGIRSVRLGGTVDQPGYAQFSEAVTRHSGSAPLSDGFIFWGYAQFLVEAVRLAGPDPTRARVEAAMTGVQDLDTGGAIPPVSYGPGDRIGTEAMLPVRCCNDQDQWLSEGPYQARFG